MTPVLREQLLAVVDQAEASSSGYRPAVAAWLFDAGLGRTWAALRAEGGSDGTVDEALVLALWRLMLDTVASRRFGVSSEDWRAGDYPDRYFPTLWLDVVPAALPQVPPSQRLGWLAALFNVGEGLPAAVRPASNQLVRLLAERAAALASDLEGTLQAALVEVGLLSPARTAPADWRQVSWLSTLDLSVVEGLVVGDVVCAGDAFVVRDEDGRPRLGLRVAGTSLVLGEVPEEPLSDSLVTLQGRTLFGPGGRLGTAGGATLGVAPSIAINASGDGVAVDAASLVAHRVWARP